MGHSQAFHIRRVVELRDKENFEPVFVSAIGEKFYEKGIRSLFSPLYGLCIIRCHYYFLSGAA